MAVAFNHLRRDVLLSTHEGVGNHGGSGVELHLAGEHLSHHLGIHGGHRLLGQIEIREHDMPASVEQQVLRLQV